ncbi:MAG: putative Fe-S cluster assembly protein SufT, partial [Bdellovibrionota bacterium]
PAGTTTTLPKGTSVMVAQSLGGTYTVYTDDGRMVRIEGRDADAIGFTPPPTVAETMGSQTVEQTVWDQLKTCFDPEIPVNIVDLGLVYLVEVNEVFEGGSRVDIRMTLTAPGCGMGAVLKNDVEKKVAQIPGVKEVAVELVFDPAWDRSMMSEAAKLQLGML